MWLLLAFIAVPLIEITLFVKVGGLIGLWPTLAIVFGTALLGHSMMRTQGGQALARLQASLAEGRGNPGVEMVHGAMILVAGILLLTPGFFTDALGLALLVPRVRTAVFNWAKSRVNIQSFGQGGFTAGFGGGFQTGTGRRPGGPAPRPGRQDVIDGDFTEIDPDSLPPRPGDAPSGWTRH